MIEKTQSKQFIILASLSAMIATILGAFVAHVLKEHLSPYQLDIFKTGIFYHFTHSLTLLCVGLLLLQFKKRIFYFAGWFFFAGILLFSGSLYLLVFTNVRAFGAITPLGGLSFLLGWFFLAYGTYQSI